MVKEGIKVYFDGEKYTWSDYEEIQEVPSDAPINYYDTYDQAREAANLLNKCIAKDPTEFSFMKDFMIKTCKDCKNYFILSDKLYKWFKDRKLSEPCRCAACRKKKKVNK